MQRSIEAPRGLRRVLAVVCSALAIATIAAALSGPGASARAAPSPRPPAAPAAAAAITPAPTASGSPAAPLPESRRLLHTSAGNRVFAYPPLAARAPAAPYPVVLMLHGMCSDPALTCDFWSDAGREGSWLVCPAGNSRCGDYDDWKGTAEEKATSLDQALEAVDRAFGAGAVTHAEGDVLIGFSRGAFVARDVAYARPGRFRGLVLLGASMMPDAARLEASGIRRVVMGAGDHDGARPMMQRAARALDAAGIPARYVSLGRIPHALPDDLGDILRRELAWIREGAAPVSR